MSDGGQMAHSYWTWPVVIITKWRLHGIFLKWLYDVFMMIVQGMKAHLVIATRFKKTLLSLLRWNFAIVQMINYICVNNIESSLLVWNITHNANAYSIFTYTKIYMWSSYQNPNDTMWKWISLCTHCPLQPCHIPCTGYIYRNHCDIYFFHLRACSPEVLQSQFTPGGVSV